MATIFSTGYVRGCYFRVSKLKDGHVVAEVKTPSTSATTLYPDFQSAKNWVDRYVQMDEEYRRGRDEN